MAVIIQSPKPPLNLFEAARLNLTSSWQTIYEVPEYFVPADGADPAKELPCACIMTGLIISNPQSTYIQASVQILSEGGVAYTVLNQLPIPNNDFAMVSLERQVMQSRERLQVKVNPGQAGTCHFSYILNQREEFEVL